MSTTSVAVFGPQESISVFTAPCKSSPDIPSSFGQTCLFEVAGALIRSFNFTGLRWGNKGDTKR